MKTGYQLKAGQSDPGSAGVLAGLKASTPVNSRQDAGAPRETPLRSACKAYRLKWIPPACTCPCFVCVIARPAPMLLSDLGIHCGLWCRCDRWNWIVQWSKSDFDTSTHALPVSIRQVAYKHRMSRRRQSGEKTAKERRHSQTCLRPILKHVVGRTKNSSGLAGNQANHHIRP